MWKYWKQNEAAQTSEFTCTTVNQSTLEKKNSVWHNLWSIWSKWKSVGDTLGSVIKYAFKSGILKHAKGITLTDLVELISSEIKHATKKFDFIVVE